MMKNTFKRGFTLIELLVVIAIIGILASVVLASLNSARDKGNDAKVKSEVSSIRGQAEIEYSRANCYGDGAGTCAAAAVAPGACPSTADTIFAEPKVAALIASADAAGGLTACSSAANQTAYAVVVQLRSNANAGFCVDSTGKAKDVTIANTGAQADVTAEVNASGLCVE